MPRPPRYDESALLDAAVRLAAAGGPAAVTMSAVARESGAPNGSVYHRFPQRAALLAELWLRTVEDFQADWLAALDSNPDDPSAAGALAARRVVAWSRANPGPAAVLLHGAEAFGKAEWPGEYVRCERQGGRRVRKALAGLAERLGAGTALDVDRIALAVVSLPLAVVRGHLRAGSPLPPHAEELAERCALDLLAGAS
ncbi:helix-turn-helix domain-containing protein [Kitasatospora sp. NPDC097643]|uniref:TetR/AcrR family transcriptional regulator n=1 Tax=Kitasatospora sp. NPDC097643 TaxID=3157230 RepID=UPI0033327F6E